MADTSNLNPCPICGGKPAWFQWGANRFQIVCQEELKGECINVKTFTYLSEEGCIKEWQNRAGKKKSIRDILDIYEELTI